LQEFLLAQPLLQALEERLSSSDVKFRILLVDVSDCSEPQGVRGNLRKIPQGHSTVSDSMIKSFKSNESEEIFRARADMKLSQVQRAARRALWRLDRAKTAQDFGMPQRTVSPNETVLYNVAVGDRCRICFEWRDGDAYNVEVVIDTGRSPEAQSRTRDNNERNTQPAERFSTVFHSLDAEDESF